MRWNIWLPAGVHLANATWSTTNTTEPLPETAETLTLIVCAPELDREAKQLHV